MLIEELMQLLKRRPGNLPMMFFVKVFQGDGIGQELVQISHTRQACLFIQCYRQSDNPAIRLNFARFLPDQRMRAPHDADGVDSFIVVCTHSSPL